MVAAPAAPEKTKPMTNGSKATERDEATGVVMG